MNRKLAIQVKDLAKPCNDVLEKLNWKWEPKEAERFIYTTHYMDMGKKIFYDRIILIAGQPLIEHDILVFTLPWTSDKRRYELSDVSPILPWEEIERVLEGVGYALTVDKTSCTLYQVFPNQKRDAYFISPDHSISVNGKTRQEAVMRAVIKLGEETINGRLHS